MNDPVRQRIRLENMARRVGYDVRYLWTAVEDSMANRKDRSDAAFNREFERTLLNLMFTGTRG